MNTPAELEKLITPFYTQALSVNAQTTPTAVLEKLLADTFESINSQETKPKTALIKQVEYFWKLIPDLRWEPQEIIASGNKVVVRAVATGSPKGSFMGLQLDGTKSFKIDTTDIHEFENGQVRRVRHLEDWATGIKQLSATGANAAPAALNVVRFRLAAGVSEQDFLAANEVFQREAMTTLAGLERREATRGTEGEWALVLRYRNAEQAKQRGAPTEAGKKLMGMMDKTTMSSALYEVVGGK